MRPSVRHPDSDKRETNFRKVSSSFVLQYQTGTARGGQWGGLSIGRLVWFDVFDPSGTRIPK